MLLPKTKAIPYNVSKLQKAAALLSLAECTALFHSLEQSFGSLYFYHMGAVVEKAQLSLEEVIACYAQYLFALQSGEELPFFSIAITGDPSTLYCLEVEGGKIVKPYTPTVQMTTHAISYIAELHTFKEKVYGKDLIPWGLQFIYPQLFQEEATHQIFNGLVDFENGKLFKEMQKKIRHLAQPVTFMTVQGEIKTACRLGPECREWIGMHPALQASQIKIA